MGVIIHLMRKEFLQLFKDKPMLGVIFIMPVIQLFILGFAITTDIKNVALEIQDQDRSETSRELIRSILESGRFILVPDPGRIQDIRNDLFRSKASIAVIIPNGFQKSLSTPDPSRLQLLVDGVDSNTALVAAGYTRRIVTQFFLNVLHQPIPVNVKILSFYNPSLESKFNIIPGIIAFLLTIVTMLLTALGLVREKEIGTLEQLNVTPIKPWQLIAGKLFPFVIVGTVEFFFSLMVAMLIFRIPMVGSIIPLAVMMLVYLLTTLGLGLFVSTITSTQQQAVFVAWYILVMSILMSGFMFPISNMPELLQKITYLIPLRYFITAIRNILLKGAELSDLMFELKILGMMGTFILGAAVLNFRKRT